MKTVFLSCMLLALTTAVLPVAEATAAAESTGIPNFHQVNPRLYRGGQPTAEGWSSLSKLGVKTVVDLRRESEHSTAEESRAVAAAGMRYFNVPMNGFEVPNPQQLGRVMELFDAGDTVFVHCKQGRDRTGTVVAIYRITREGWDNAKALDEARDCGIHWYSQGMKRLILDYPREAPATTAAR